MREYDQIIITYHIRTRELKLCEIEADLIRKNNLAKEVVIINQNELAERAYEFNPDVVISHSPRDERASALFTMLKFAYNCVWIAIPAESFFLLNDFHIRINLGQNKQPMNLVDEYFFVSPGFANRGTRYLIEQKKISSKERIHTFGLLSYDEQLKESFCPMGESYKRLEAKCKKFRRAILIVLSSMGRPETIEEWIKTSAFDVHSKSERIIAEKRIKMLNEFNIRYIQMIKTIASVFPDDLILLKMHPTEIDEIKKGGEGTNYKILKGIKNIEVIDADEAITNYFSLVQCMIHYGSTTGLEAYMCNTYSICLFDQREKERIYLGNKKVEIHQIDRVIDLLKGDIAFEENEELDHYCSIYMNYTRGKTYLPSVMFVELMKKIKKRQVLCIDQKYVKKNLLYKSCIKRLAIFHVDLIRAYLQKNTSKANQIKKWLLDYYKGWKRRTKSAFL